MVSSIGRDVVKLSGKTKFLGFGHPVGLRPSAAGTTSPFPCCCQPPTPLSAITAFSWSRSRDILHQIACCCCRSSGLVTTSNCARPSERDCWPSAAGFVLFGRFTLPRHHPGTAPTAVVFVSLTEVSSLSYLK
ncbi:uncharacterized protein LOC120416093 [Culex pipiens pallens]|uniref:uncharacterized protein LOC120416093 n=1 Tax=Culex pipiens pallens TaxID=42434 RepID=UPI00195381AB|nr:uncharacterized protein LOC120416093 [Culex pipiens pallens]